MKKVAIFLLLIVNIYAQQSGILKSKYGSEEFEGLTFDNYRTEKSIPKLNPLKIILNREITNKIDDNATGIFLRDINLISVFFNILNIILIDLYYSYFHK